VTPERGVVIELRPTLLKTSDITIECSGSAHCCCVQVTVHRCIQHNTHILPFCMPSSLHHALQCTQYLPTLQTCCKRKPSANSTRSTQNYGTILKRTAVQVTIVGDPGRVAQWLRCCTTNRKVAGSIPDGVIGIFH